ncbi:hypothetical protein lerEdw1_004198, partial [Lerista edwardsae]
FSFQKVLPSLAVLCLTLALGHAASFYSTEEPPVTLDDDSTLDDDDDNAPVVDDGDSTLDDDDDGDTTLDDDDDTPPVDDGDSSLDDEERDCADPYDNSNHAQGSQWESADCEICECGETGVKCRTRYGDDFPDVPGCKGVVDPKTCAIEYYEADDPSLPCLANHKSSRVLPSSHR